MPGKGKIGIVMIQHHIGDNVKKNLDHVEDLIRNAVKSYKPKIVTLPENFNSPYGEEFFEKYAEAIPGGYTAGRLSQIAKEQKIYIVGAAIPERDGEHIHNTATVWGPDGSLIAKHRKVHLYDVDFKTGHSFHESSKFTPGDKVTVFEVDGAKFGLSICFDIYFDEFFKLYRKQGIDIMFWPTAFNPTIGPLHWDLLIRARATDNQIYVVATSPARDESSKYVGWGYSMIADPWGRVVVKADEKERILHQEIDLDEIQELRDQIPIWPQRRTDLY